MRKQAKKARTVRLPAKIWEMVEARAAKNYRLVNKEVELLLMLALSKEER
jgi:hypothetical protein